MRPGPSPGTGSPASGCWSATPSTGPTLIVAVSAFTAERVSALVGRTSVVVHSAPGPDMVPAPDEEVDRVRSRYGLPERFVLHVGNIEPRKDIATLAEACRRVGVPLVLTGHSLWSHQSPPRRHRDRSRARASDLPPLYGAATLVGYASRYEGFGLPPLEAMACGAAVVSTPVPAVVEVVGDGAATFRPGDVDGLAGTLRDLLADEGRRQRTGPARSGTGPPPELAGHRPGYGPDLPVVGAGRLTSPEAPTRRLQSAPGYADTRRCFQSGASCGSG